MFNRAVPLHPPEVLTSCGLTQNESDPRGKGVTCMQGAFVLGFETGSPVTFGEDVGP